MLSITLVIERITERRNYLVFYDQVSWGQSPYERGVGYGYLLQHHSRRRLQFLKYCAQTSHSLAIYDS